MCYDANRKSLRTQFNSLTNNDRPCYYVILHKRMSSRKKRDTPSIDRDFRAVYFEWSEGAKLGQGT